METGELSQQQSARMAELPEDYRVVGVERRAPLARRPTGQIISHAPTGRPPDRGHDRGPRRRPATVSPVTTTDQRGDASWQDSS